DIALSEREHPALAERRWLSSRGWARSLPPTAHRVSTTARMWRDHRHGVFGLVRHDEHEERIEARRQRHAARNPIELAAPRGFPSLREVPYEGDAAPPIRVRMRHGMIAREIEARREDRFPGAILPTQVRDEHARRRARKSSVEPTHRGRPPPYVVEVVVVEV